MGDNYPQPSASKLLSICMMARDDDYLPDFKYRMTTTMDHMARSLQRLGRLNDVEMVVTDWGSQTPLAHTLLLSPEAGKISRFIYIPPEVVRTAQHGEEGFHFSYAMNTYLRRACGQFIMLYLTDTLITQQGLKTLLELLRGNLNMPIALPQTYFFCSRYRVPREFVQRQPDLEEWDRFLLLNAGNLDWEPGTLLGLSKGAGSPLLHRSLWHRLRGFDETMGVWGWHEIELAPRITGYCPWIELSSLGIALFHMEHPSLSATIVKPNPQVCNLEFQVNGEDWGLGEYDLEIQVPRNIRVLSGRAGSLALPLAPGPQDPEPWTLSYREVLAELASDRVRDQVRGVIHVLLSEGEAWKLDERDLEALFFWPGTAPADAPAATWNSELGEAVRRG